MRTRRYISLFGRARHTLRRLGRRNARRRTPMQFLDLELFQVDIRM